MSTKTKTSIGMSVLLQEGGKTKVQNINAQLSSGNVSLVAGDILDLLPEIIPDGNFDFLLSFFRKQKATGDHLALHDKHETGDGSALAFCNELAIAKTEEDITVLFGSSEKGCPIIQGSRWKNTDLFTVYLSDLLKE